MHDSSFMLKAHSSCRYIFGHKSDVKSSLHFLDENALVYPAGHNVVIYKENQEQRFIHGTDVSGQQAKISIVALAVSPNKRCAGYRTLRRTVHCVQHAPHVLSLYAVWNCSCNDAMTLTVACFVLILQICCGVGTIRAWYRDGVRCEYAEEAQSVADGGVRVTRIRVH